MSLTSKTYFVIIIIKIHQGGLKAVVWADTVQLLLTLGSLFSVVMLGIVAVGSFSDILEIADKGGRLILWEYVKYAKHDTIKFSLPSENQSSIFCHN